jgi:succinate dehydrogenase / fumarate reductase cytochrome b subunit
MTEGASARPLSPHLQIWRWTATMAASITHRATGIALYGGFVLLAVWFVAAAIAPGPFDRISNLIGSPLGLVILFGFAWSLVFHTLNGLRHLYWDTGRGLAPKTAAMTSWLVFGASFVTAALVFAAALVTAGR